MFTEEKPERNLEPQITQIFADGRIGAFDFWNSCRDSQQVRGSPSRSVLIAFALSSLMLLLFFLFSGSHEKHTYSATKGSIKYFAAWEISRASEEEMVVAVQVTAFNQGPGEAAIEELSPYQNCGLWYSLAASNQYHISAFMGSFLGPTKLALRAGEGTTKAFKVTFQEGKYDYFIGYRPVLREARIFEFQTSTNSLVARKAPWERFKDYLVRHSSRKVD